MALHHRWFSPPDFAECAQPACRTSSHLLLPGCTDLPGMLSPPPSGLVPATTAPLPCPDSGRRDAYPCFQAIVLPIVRLMPGPLAPMRPALVPGSRVLRLARAPCQSGYTPGFFPTFGLLQPDPLAPVPGGFASIGRQPGTQGFRY